MQSGLIAFKLTSESILPMYVTTPRLPRRKRSSSKNTPYIRSWKLQL